MQYNKTNMINGNYDFFKKLNDLSQNIQPQAIIKKQNIFFKNIILNKLMTFNYYNLTKNDFLIPYTHSNKYLTK